MRIRVTYALTAIQDPSSCPTKLGFRRLESWSKDLCKKKKTRVSTTEYPTTTPFSRGQQTHRDVSLLRLLKPCEMVPLRLHFCKFLQACQHEHRGRGTTIITTVTTTHSWFRFVRSPSQVGMGPGRKRLEERTLQTYMRGCNWPQEIDSLGYARTQTVTHSQRFELRQVGQPRG